MRSKFRLTPYVPEHDAARRLGAPDHRCSTCGTSTPVSEGCPFATVMNVVDASGAYRERGFCWKGEQHRYQHTLPGTPLHHTSLGMVLCEAHHTELRIFLPDVKLTGPLTVDDISFLQLKCSMCETVPALNNGCHNEEMNTLLAVATMLGTSFSSTPREELQRHPAGPGDNPRDFVGYSGHGFRPPSDRFLEKRRRKGIGKRGRKR